MTAFVSTTYATDGLPVTEVVAELCNAGIRNIELGSTHSWETGLVERLVGFDATYLVHNYFPPPVEPFIVNLGSLRDDVRIQSLEHAYDCVRFAKELGADMYTVHPGFVGEPVSPGRDDALTFDFEFLSPTPTARLKEAVFTRFLESVALISEVAGEGGILLAVESEGSVGKHDRLILQTQEEMSRFFAARQESHVGINMNLGHLNLAATAFGFEPLALLDQFSHRIVAFELSHNDGLVDEHRPPRRGTWYEQVLLDPRFGGLPVVIECRATPISEVLEAYHWVSEAREGVGR